MVKLPTPRQLQEISVSYNLDLSDGDLESFLGLMKGVLASYDRLDQLVEPAPEVRYPRADGYRPEPEDNPLGAWYYRCSIKGAQEGLLSGKRVVIKDNACVAGVPMMNGTAVLEGYVPEADAYTLNGGPAGARVPAALNPGAVAREAARRQLRAVSSTHPDEAEGVALFLGAAAAGDPGYLGASDRQGDPTGELDLSRPLPPDASVVAVLAGALWAWADASGDPVGAARAALAAARALGERADAGGRAALLSLVAGQLEGAERDQACAVFRARLASAGIEACP